MDLVVSTQAIFEMESGELEFCAPADYVLAPGQGSVALPVDFADWCYVWDNDARTYLPDLNAHKASAFARVKELRELAKDGGLTTPLGPLETDPDSRTNINGAVQMATILGEQFSIQWRMSDNTVTEPLDAATMVNLGIMVGLHINACQLRKNELDAAIAAAATLEDLTTIDLEAGWP